MKTTKITTSTLVALFTTTILLSGTVFGSDTDNITGVWNLDAMGDPLISDCTYHSEVFGSGAEVVADVLYILENDDHSVRVLETITNKPGGTPTERMHTFHSSGRIFNDTAEGGLNRYVGVKSCGTSVTERKYFIVGNWVVSDVEIDGDRELLIKTEELWMGPVFLAL